MNDDEENGNPLYAEDAPIAFDAQYAPLIGRRDKSIEFVATGPRHHIGSGWIVGVFPIRTRKGDLEPVYMVRCYWLDGAEVPPASDSRDIIFLGEPEITQVFPSAADAAAGDAAPSDAPLDR